MKRHLSPITIYFYAPKKAEGFWDPVSSYIYRQPEPLRSILLGAYAAYYLLFGWAECLKGPVETR